MTNVLVIGADGFIGRALTSRLAARSDISVVAGVRDAGMHFEGVKTIVGDLNDESYCRTLIAGVDIVYYLAGYRSNISQHLEKSFDYFIGNVQPLATFLSVLRDCPAGKLIYMSSVLVEYLGEDSSEDGYLLGKGANEFMIRSFKSQYPDWKIHTVRSAAVYGPGESRDSTAFLPSIIRRTREAHDEVSVWGTGERRMQFIYIDDLIDNLEGLLNEDCDGIVSIGNSEVHSVKEIVETIIELVGNDLRPVFDPTKPDKPSKIIDFHNVIAPKTSLKEGISRIVQDVKND